MIKSKAIQSKSRKKINNRRKSRELAMKSIYRGLVNTFDLNQIQKVTGKNFSNFVVFLEDKTINLPLPRKITVDLPNNHFKYAITWYSISISIFFYFLYFRRQQ